MSEKGNLKQLEDKEKELLYRNKELEEKLGFIKSKNGLYHYTSREVFWKIIEGESFLARHILFSNDFEEKKIGEKKIASKLSKKDPVLLQNSQPFMVCFSEASDQLSQWRGYAQAGISMEFDFAKGIIEQEKGFSSYQYYTILNSDREEQENLVYALAAPYQVFYTESEQGNTELDKKIEDILALKLENPQVFIQKMIPYIKNNQFQEEKEYRLIFDLESLMNHSDYKSKRQKQIYLDVKGIKKPNIRVRFGKEKEDTNENIAIYYGDLNYKEELSKILEGFQKENPEIEVKLVIDREKYPMEKNEIIISNGLYQEALFYKLKDLFEGKLLKEGIIKIWCDGRMPLRKIIVGTSDDAELMKECIEQYKINKYWMTYVDVEISKIPWRLY